MPFLGFLPDEPEKSKYYLETNQNGNVAHILVRRGQHRCIHYSFDHIGTSYSLKIQPDECVAKNGNDAEGSHSRKGVSRISILIVVRICHCPVENVETQQLKSSTKWVSAYLIVPNLSPLELHVNYVAQDRSQQPDGQKSQEKADGWARISDKISIQIEQGIGSRWRCRWIERWDEVVGVER